MSGKKILVTGGAGFIGSTVVRRIIDHSDDQVINLDKLTYAANLENVAGAANSSRYTFAHADICDGPTLRQIFIDHQPDMVMHLAAETHVDRSIDGPNDFISTNIIGTYQLLQESLAYYRSLDDQRKVKFRFHHVSTDEVFGSLTMSDPPFHPKTRYDPRSPYSASKAASDHLVHAWSHTYGLPIVLSNCSNNYGPFQFPEKLIPLVIIRALAGRNIPIYGAGENIRDWLYVDDHADALLTILRTGQMGETYLVGGNAEFTNIEVVMAICALLDKRLPDSPHTPHEQLISFVRDRPGHDQRYAIDSSNLREQLGWSPSIDFFTGLERTVDWYLNHEAWWASLLSERYDGGRLGLSKERKKK